MSDERLLEEYEAALKAERNAWLALNAVSPLAPQRSALQSQWQQCATRIQELAAKLNNE